MRMKNMLTTPIVFSLFLMNTACSSPFFGEQLKSEHGQENVYVPPTYDQILPPQSVEVSEGEVDKISLSWLPVSLAANYRIYRSENQETSFEILGESTEPTFEDNGSVLSLKSGISYYYRVASVTVDGIESELTAPMRGSCYLSNGELVPPARFSATQGAFSHKIVLEWDEIPNAQSYRVFRSQKADGSDATLLKDEVSTNSFEDSNDLQQGVIYYYQVQSVGTPSLENQQEVMTSALSKVVSGFLSDPQVTSVSGLWATKGTYSDKVVLNWTAVDVPVRIYRSEEQGGEATVLVESLEAGVSSYEDLKSGGTLKEQVYFYQIQAIKEGNRFGVLSEAVEGSVKIEAPQITLQGEDVILVNINRNEKFVDPGYGASDEFDGNLTDYVHVDDSAIDYKKRGEWEVIYTVTDSAKNKAEVKRKVKTIFLPNLDNAELKLVSQYAAGGQPFEVAVSGIEPAEVPAEMGTSYTYSWSVASGTGSGNGTQGSLTVTTADSALTEKEVTVTVSTADGSVKYSKNFEIYPSLTPFTNAFAANGTFGTYKADYKVRVKTTAFGSWIVGEDEGLTQDYSYEHWGGGDGEMIVSAADGNFIIGNLETDSGNWADVGDKAHSAVRLYSPEVTVFAGKTYTAKAIVKREAGATAAVYLRVGKEGDYQYYQAQKTGEWETLSFDYSPKTDGKITLEVYKMPTSTRDWSALNNSILQENNDSKEVRVDEISISYKN